MNAKQIIISMIAIAVLGLLPVGYAIAQPVDNPNIHIFIESRFILWDENEKMLDNNFTITIINLNQSENNTFKLTVNQNITFGNFTGMIQIPVNVSDERVSIYIEINGEPAYTVSNIRIITGVTSTGIDQINKPWTINLSPLEWSKKQWNIFFALLISAFVSVYVAYIAVMYFRKHDGTREIK